MLTETAALVPHEPCSALLALARRRPIPKPSDHKGGEDTDMFEVALPLAMLESILDIVDNAARRGLSTPRSTKIGHFATAWRELRDWQAANRV